MDGEKRVAWRVLLLLLALAAAGVLVVAWLGWWGPIFRALGLA